MHAIFVQVTFKPGLEDAAQRKLAENVIPNAKQAPGFQRGYWLHSEDGRSGMSIEVFDTAENAKAELGRRSTEMPPEMPVTIDSAGLYEVVGDA